MKPTLQIDGFENLEAVAGGRRSGAVDINSVGDLRMGRCLITMVCHDQEYFIVCPLPCFYRMIP
jgi:hypothetical protein